MVLRPTTARKTMARASFVAALLFLHGVACTTFTSSDPAQCIVSTSSTCACSSNYNAAGCESGQAKVARYGQLENRTGYMGRTAGWVDMTGYPGYSEVLVSLGEA